MKKRPTALQERVFKKLFKLAEIAKYNKMERAQYEQSLKQYRDLNNVVAQAKLEGRMEEIIAIIKNGIDGGFTLKQISTITNRSTQELILIIKEQGWKIPEE
ncbi:MAG: PD-(D/E)XK nuclease family transposase [Bacteroidota bacterium]